MVLIFLNRFLILGQIEITFSLQEVDFFTEPRTGDRVCIVVEEKHLDGEVLGFGRILVAEYAGERVGSRAIRYVDEAGNLDWYDDSGRSVRRAFLKSPLNYRRISSHFTARRRHPILKRVMPHWGVDYVAPRGMVFAAMVPAAVGRRAGKTETVAYLLSPSADWPRALGARQRRILDELHEARKQGVEPLPLEQLHDWLFSCPEHYQPPPPDRQ